MQEAPPSKSEANAQNKAQIFIARWQGVALTDAAELTFSQTFNPKLCMLLEVGRDLTAKLRIVKVIDTFRLYTK